MINNQQYKLYIRQIANIFCKDQTLKAFCVSNITQRMQNNFDDTIFGDYFLQNFDKARFYSFNIQHAASSEGFIKYNVSGFDIVTGKNKSMMIDGIPGAQRNNYQWVFDFHLNSWYDRQNIPYHAKYLGKVNGRHIVQIQMPNTYGIVWVPNQVGENEIKPKPKQQPPTQPPEQVPVPEATPLPDVFNSPVVLLAGLGLFLYLLRK